MVVTTTSARACFMTILIYEYSFDRKLRLRNVLESVYLQLQCLRALSFSSTDFLQKQKVSVFIQFVKVALTTITS